MQLRNTFYDHGIFESHRFDLPVICVGNLSVGGTGKSPMVEYLISLLQEKSKVATLSRGYKRTTTGFHLLNGNESAAETGDEPLQFKTKFPEVMVAVDEKRRHGIEQLLKLEPKPEVILLDDAFQHRKVSAGLNIILTPHSNLYTKDLVLPAGNLREPVSGADRAGIVVVTKCPENLKEEEKERIAKSLKLNEDQELFFSTIAYNSVALSADAPVELETFRGKDLCVVTGIANPDPFIEYLKKQGIQFEHLEFPDHHNFTASELETIQKHPLVLTTEKDFMRLKGELPKETLFYLPIKTKFLGRKEKFDKMIENYAIKK
ncbi:tetraacyldisaccharide 4'-kinase [Salinimicrobium marinum]|uniref:Tetraacyldisaccharide 4'-kinase n=2 Tax=Salinimicrobium marinum TaxID=680283 RepID=A0A918SIS1_9FLAO|nr:tetraacyldisaccharide 4'-kinase [Salinimicrobium marinum]